MPPLMKASRPQMLSPRPVRDSEDAEMTLRALKALVPGAVLLLITCCGAQGSMGQEHDTMTQLSESFQRVVKKIAAASVTLDVVAYVRPEEDDNSANSGQHY